MRVIFDGGNPDAVETSKAAALHHQRRPHLSTSISGKEQGSDGTPPPNHLSALIGLVLDLWDQQCMYIYHTIERVRIYVVAVLL